MVAQSCQRRWCSDDVEVVVPVQSIIIIFSHIS